MVHLATTWSRILTPTTHYERGAFCMDDKVIVFDENSGRIRAEYLLIRHINAFLIPLSNFASAFCALVFTPCIVLCVL